MYPMRPRRGGRVAEGAPLLREYGLITHRGFESLPLRQVEKNAPVAQLDRVPGYEPGGRRFESFRARHYSTGLLAGFLLDAK